MARLILAAHRCHAESLVPGAKVDLNLGICDRAGVTLLLNKLLNRSLRRRHDDIGRRRASSHR
jgi:hypothetical protein